MTCPNASQYFEAVQNPPVCFRDAELRQGAPVLNKRGVPILYAGNFAAVFHLRCPSRQEWAVKCFTREVPGLQQRYQAISAALKEAALPFMVDFHYLDQGMRIGSQWYPILKMRWVEGLALNQFVESALDKPKLLQQLADLWEKLARSLQGAGIAHGDLQHGNVLLIPGSKATALALRLIDYDGMYVTALAQKKPGEKGHANYQHPQRMRDGTYNASVDRFSHLVICCALRCLAVGGRSLWRPTYDSGENLLFREEDFRAPAQSALMRELWQLPDQEARDLLGHLVLASQGPLDQVPILDDVMFYGRSCALTAAQEQQVAALLGPATQRATALVPNGETIRSWSQHSSRKAMGRRWLRTAAATAVFLGVVVCLAALAWNGSRLPSQPQLGAKVESKVEPLPPATEAKPPVTRTTPPVPLPPLDPAWLAAVAKLPVKEQVQEVAKLLMKRNPKFKEGRVEYQFETQIRIEGTVRKETEYVTSLTFQASSDGVHDLSPLRAFPGLKQLSCRHKQLSDLGPLKGMPLISLDCNGSGVSDLSPLAGMKLINLSCNQTPVADLGPLRGMPLRKLDALGTKVTDLSPLQETSIKSLNFDVQIARDRAILKSIPTLETINGKEAAEVLN